LTNIIRQRMRWFIQDLSKNYKIYASMFTRRELFNLMEEHDLCYDPKTKTLYLNRLVRAHYLKAFHRQGRFQLINPEIERLSRKSKLEQTLEVPSK